MRALLALSVGAPLAACSSIPRIPYTAGEAALASVANIPGARVFADASAETITEIAGRPGARKQRFTISPSPAAAATAPTGPACSTAGRPPAPGPSSPSSPG